MTSYATSSQRTLATASANFARNKSLWTPKKIVKSPHRDVVIPNRTVVQHVWENLGKWADKTAIVSMKKTITKYYCLIRHRSNVPCTDTTVDSNKLVYFK